MLEELSGLPDDTELMGAAAAGTAGRLAAEAGMGMPLLFRPSTRLEGRELQKTETFYVQLSSTHLRPVSSAG